MPLSQIIQESPGYNTNLFVSSTGHQTSLINSFFLSKKNCFIMRFLGHFCTYRRLHLPVKARVQNMFSRDIKRLSFRCQTLKFSRPNVKLSFSALLKGKMFSINKKGRNYRKGVPLSSDLQNQVKELAQDYCFSEVGRRLCISKGAVSKIVKQYNLTGSTAPKKLNHVRTVPRCTFQDSILLETMVQARGLSSLKELHDDLAIHGDCGELSTSTISRNMRNKLPSGRNYSRKRLGKCASERFTPENIGQLSCTLTI